MEEMMVSSQQAAKRTGSAHILLFPFPAQGHMLPMLDLAAHLSTAGLVVTVLVTPKNLPLLSPLFSSCPSIHPLVLPFPDHPSIPSGVENVKDLPASLFGYMLHVMTGLYSPLLAWARANTTNPLDAIVSDFFLGWTCRLAADLGVPRLVFYPSGALTISIIHSLWRRMPRRPDDADDHFSVDFPEIPNSPSYRWYQLSSLFRFYWEKEPDPISQSIKDCLLENMESWGFVFNSFYGLEGCYLEYLRKDLGHDRVWAVGPLSSPAAAVSADGRGGPSSVPAGGVISWLDRREQGSVVYVCFGSQVSLSPAQGAAVAAALERSGAHFVWGVRGGEAVPEGFEERVEGRGMVIRGWAPQVAILSHAAVGTFVTHCGLNSVLEAVVAGVAMLAWPMGADQFMNARLLEEEAGVAVRVCERRDGVPDPDELARAVAESVAGARPERAKVVELRDKALEAVKEGGSSFGDLKWLVEQLSKLHSKKE